MRVDEDGGHARLHAGLEIGAGRPPVAVGRKQRIDVRGGHGPAVGAPGQRRQDACGAALLVARASRTASEDPPAARGIPHSPDVVRPAYRDRADGRQAAGVVVVAEAARRERQPQTLGRTALPGERHGHRMRAGLYRQAHEQLLVELLRCLQATAPVDAADDVGRPHREAPDEPSVQPHVDPVLVLHVGRPITEPLQPTRHDGPLQLDADAVLGVDRKGVAHADAAARAERQLLAHPVVLAEVARCVVDHLSRADVGVANRQAAYSLGGRQVALQQRLRNREHVADVVEAVARVVGRQQRSAVDVEGQEIADGVGVLGAIQAMHRRRPPGIHPLGRRCVQVLREPGGEPGVGGFIRPRPAGRRHLAGLQLLQHLLPQRGVGRDVREIRLVEREIRRAQPVVVATGAVALDDRAEAVGGRGRTLGAVLGERRRGRDDAGHHHGGNRRGDAARATPWRHQERHWRISTAAASARARAAWDGRRGASAAPSCSREPSSSSWSCRRSPRR